MKITEKEIKEAASLLLKYKDGKASLEDRIVKEEEFWKLRHFDTHTDAADASKPTSAWMFNSICNKHADAMDSYPEIRCLPREKSDERSAEIMTEIIPVIMERNEFDNTYSDNWWYKLKHGCAAYGIFWDNAVGGGMGDVTVKKIDLLNIFWEPGITNIEQSRNLFIVNLIPTDDIRARYPKTDITGGDTIETKKYIYDDDIDTSDKTAVVDWYYKRDGKLHYCKFAEGKLLFSSENEKGYEDGWYTDGEYPIVLDVLYPLEGTPAGFGIIALCKDAQLYIDKLDHSIMKYAHAAANARFMAQDDSGINEKDLLNPEKAIVRVTGSIDERRIKQITLGPLNGYIMNFREAKINEMKETSSNRDFSNGSAANGVTSGTAIATLQEAGNKTSRDMIAASYRAYTAIGRKIIERMRQFYTEERVFRIMGESGTEYVKFSNGGIAPQPNGEINGEELFRVPIFDIKIKAQKKSAFSTLSQNETAMNLYSAGFFNPEMAQAALGALDMMEFEGKDSVRDYISQGQTLMQVVQQLQVQVAQLSQALGSAVNPPAQTAGSANATERRASGQMQGVAENAGTPRTAQAAEPIGMHNAEL